MFYINYRTLETNPVWSCTGICDFAIGRILTVFACISIAFRGDFSLHRFGFPFVVGFYWCGSHGNLLLQFNRVLPVLLPCSFYFGCGPCFFSIVLSAFFSPLRKWRAPFDGCVIFIFISKFGVIACCFKLLYFICSTVDATAKHLPGGI